MGTRTPRTDMLDPVTEWMIDRYVEEALAETGTAARASPYARGRFSRGSKPPRSDEEFLVPPPVDPGGDPDSPEFVEESATDLTGFAEEQEDTNVCKAPPSRTPRMR